MTTASAIIVAAGRGKRMGSEMRKGFLPLAGRPLFVHAAEAFARAAWTDELILVVHEADVDAARFAVETIAPDAIVVQGGLTRRDSSLAGVRAASGEIILIHDGCRPFVDAGLIERVVDGARRHGAAVPVLPTVETLYSMSGNAGCVQRIVDRSEIVRAQTPQGFRRSLILRCLEAADPGITDDASAVIACGESVATVPGGAVNLKVTYPSDLRWAEAWIESADDLA